MEYQKYRGIPNALREYREKKGLTQEAVGKLLGFRDGTWISRWEHGEAMPNLVSAMRLSVLFAASINDLFSDLAMKVISYMNDTGCWIEF